MQLKNCPNCGKRLSGDINACPDCNHIFETNITNKKLNTTSKLKYIIPAILLLIIIVLSILAIFTTHKKSKDSSNVSSTSQIASKYVGVYSGDDNEILVLDSDGLAYYYCNLQEFIELACPWTCDGEYIYIDLFKLHCTVKAPVTDENSLLFTSDSRNWNSELFTRLNVSPKEYLTKKVYSYDKQVSVMDDGKLELRLAGLKFIVPKYYRDIEDDSDNQDDTVILVNTDVDTDYTSGLAFYVDFSASIDNYNIAPETVAEIFAAGFYEEPSAKFVQTISYQGYDADIFEISGIYNNGFGKIYGHTSSGRLVIIKMSENKFVYCLFVQNDDRNMDGTNDFLSIFEE